MKCENHLELQDVTKTWNSSRSLTLPIHLNRRPAAVNAGYSYSRMTDVAGSSSTAAGTAIVRDSATHQGTTGSATSIFIRWLNFTVYSLLSFITRITHLTKRFVGVPAIQNVSWCRTMFTAMASYLSYSQTFETGISHKHRCRKYWCIFNHFYVIRPKATILGEITQRLELLRRSRSSKITEFGTNQKIICDFC